MNTKNYRKHRQNKSLRLAINTYKYRFSLNNPLRILVSHCLWLRLLNPLDKYGVIEWGKSEKDTNTWLLTALTILTNSAMIYGLTKLKHFIANFTVKAVLADKIYHFLKQASIYTFFASFSNFYQHQCTKLNLFLIFSILRLFLPCFLTC